MVCGWIFAPKDVLEERGAQWFFGPFREAFIDMPSRLMLLGGDFHRAWQYQRVEEDCCLNVSEGERKLARSRVCWWLGLRSPPGTDFSGYTFMALTNWQNE
jgi:hypothetical protein